MLHFGLLHRMSQHGIEHPPVDRQTIPFQNGQIIFQVVSDPLDIFTLPKTIELPQDSHRRRPVGSEIDVVCRSVFEAK